MAALTHDCPPIMKNGFLSLTEHALDQCRKHGHKVALLVVKLSHLDEQLSDEVLAEVATRIWESLGEEDLVARINAQDFAVLLSRVATDEVGNRMALRLMRTISDPIRSAGKLVKLTATIGVATGPWTNENADTLMKIATPREQARLYKLRETAFAV